MKLLKIIFSITYCVHPTVYIKFKTSFSVVLGLISSRKQYLNKSFLNGNMEQHYLVYILIK